MESVKHFITSSYHSDKLAFVLETVSLVFTVVASVYVAIVAGDPDLRYAYPLFLVGSISGTIAFYRRQLIMPLTLNKIFTIINIVGLGRAMAWW